MNKHPTLPGPRLFKFQGVALTGDCNERGTEDFCWLVEIFNWWAEQPLSLSFSMDSYELEGVGDDW